MQQRNDKLEIFKRELQSSLTSPELKRDVLRALNSVRQTSPEMAPKSAENKNTEEAQDSKMREIMDALEAENKAMKHRIRDFDQKSEEFKATLQKVIPIMYCMHVVPLSKCFSIHLPKSLN